MTHESLCAPHREHGSAVRVAAVLPAGAAGDDRGLRGRAIRPDGLHVRHAAVFSAARGSSACGA
jgi:hypothetical protein